MVDGVRQLIVVACVGACGMGMPVVACRAASSDAAHYERVRARVTAVWPAQRMADDWTANLRELPGAPALAAYLRDYQRVDVFAGRIRRFGRTESPLVPVDMQPEVGDVIEFEIGKKAGSEMAFGDLAFATLFACGREDRRCLRDPDIAKALGRIRTTRAVVPADAALAPNP